VAKHSVLEHQLASGPDHVHDDACDLARLLSRANCDHNRSMGARTQLRIRETLGTRIRHLEHEHGSRSSPLRSPAPARFPLVCAW
jgi:hypothetical protein